MRLVVEIGNEKDASLFISLVKRLNGRIVEKGESLSKTNKEPEVNPVSILENISKRGGINSIPTPFKQAKPSRKAGLAKGLIRMKDDFDKPITFDR